MVLFLSMWFNKKAWPKVENRIGESYLYMIRIMNWEENYEIALYTRRFTMEI